MYDEKALSIRAYAWLIPSMPSHFLGNASRTRPSKKGRPDACLQRHFDLVLDLDLAPIEQVLHTPLVPTRPFALLVSPLQSTGKTTNAAHPH